MSKLTEEKKIKIGLILNKVCTALFVFFFLVTCVIVTVGSFKLYLALVGTIFALFVICSLVARNFLKDYKPDNYTKPKK